MVRNVLKMKPYEAPVHSRKRARAMDQWPNCGLKASGMAQFSMYGPLLFKFGPLSKILGHPVIILGHIAYKYICPWPN